MLKLILLIFFSELGLHQSLFSHLDRPGVSAELSVQYRMNKCITDLANGLTYEGKLECANDEVSQATIKLQQLQVGYLIVVSTF